MGQKTYTGIELRTRFWVSGLGKIGGGVAKRALAMEMKVLTYDPYVSSAQAHKLGVELVDLDEIIEKSDFISVHMPLTEETRHLIGRDSIAKMKPGVRIINVARGGVVDEEALYEALKDGKIAGAAIDVWEKEPETESPLFELNNVVITPHLGASTEEAQVNVAVDVAKEIVNYHRGEMIRNAVNAPAISTELMERLNPYMVLNEKLGKLVTQLAGDNIHGIDIQYNGDIASHNVSILSSYFLVGLLKPILDTPVNLVNAPHIARAKE